MTGASRGSARTRAVGFELRGWDNSARSFEAVPPGVLDVSGGLPDARLFPADVLARAYRRSLKRSAGKLLAFGSPAGDPLLRERLAAMLATRRGLAISAEDLLVTRGSQLALHLLSLALVREGDTVAVESPGYPSAREAFSLLGAARCCATRCVPAACFTPAATCSSSGFGGT